MSYHLPDGFRWVETGEIIEEGDKYWQEGDGWLNADDDVGTIQKLDTDGMTNEHIRKG